MKKIALIVTLSLQITSTVFAQKTQSLEIQALQEAGHSELEFLTRISSFGYRIIKACGAGTYLKVKEAGGVTKEALSTFSPECQLQVSQFVLYNKKTFAPGQEAAAGIMASIRPQPAIEIVTKQVEIQALPLTIKTSAPQDPTIEAPIQIPALSLNPTNSPFENSRSSDFEISSAVNGSLVATAVVHQASSWAIIQVKKNNRIVFQSQRLDSPFEKKWQTKIYFRSGPGDYKINLGVHYDKMNPDTFYVEGSKDVTVANVPNPDIAPSTLVQSDDVNIIQLAEQTAARFKTAREKAQAIHDWVSQNIAYDTDRLYRQRKSGSNSIDDGYSSISALSTLKFKKAICHGYALLTLALLRVEQIPSRYVIGDYSSDGGTTWTKDGHAWVHAYVDGRWIQIDTTWDSGYVEPTPTPNLFIFHPLLEEKYFDMPQIEYAKSHKGDTEMMNY